MSGMEVDEELPSEVLDLGAAHKNDTKDESSSGRSVMAGGIPGSVSVSLHPLVLLNVSDHWTRQRAQQSQTKDAPQDTQVYGAIIGKQTGREVEIMNSFELQYEIVGELVVLSKEYYRLKEEQYKQVFSEMDLLGWYTTGGEANEKDLDVHKQVCELVEGPLLLKLDPAGGRAGELGVSVCESVVVGAGTTDIMLVQLSYTLATEEAERVGVDHVARMASQQSVQQSNVSDNLHAQCSAVRMLLSRVQLVLSYVEACERGEMVLDQQLMRQISSLAHRLPLLDNENFNEHFFTQSNDVALLAYLGAITKSCNSCNRFLNRFNLLHERLALGRKMRGIFF
ncbi:Rpn11/EIF3F C-terminal [Trinorchestia longiramus]|nr:Rpn11/EIF3F C-terminal [Trinorchestia longiramus]